MALIKPQTFMPEIIGRSFGLINKHLHTAIGGVYVPVGKGMADHTGSCVFVRFKGLDYIVTAAHVLKDMKTEGLYIGSVGGIGSFGGEFKAVRQSDILDVAIARFPEKLRTRLAGLSFYDITHCASQAREWRPERCVIMGLPASKNKRRHDKKAPPVRQLYGFLATPKDDQKDSDLPHISGASHIVLHWDGEPAMTLAGNWDNPPGLRGTSGGAIIDLGDLEDENVLAGIRTPMPTIEGIVSLWRKKKTVIGIRFSAMIETLNRANVWPTLLDDEANV